MDLEFGMKVTIKNASYKSCYLNFQLSKDVKGHLFQSAETNNMLILTVHLKGYEAENIQIGINDDGTIMEMRCEKPVDVIVMLGQRLETKGTETWKLKKRFRIPEGVSLDEIEAKFAEDEYLLTVLMPKRVEGIVGKVIEEIEGPYEIPESSLREAEIVELRKETDDPQDSLAGPSDPPHSDDQEAGRKEERIEDHPEMAKKPDDDDDQETKPSMGSNGEEVGPKGDHVEGDHAESSSGINASKHEEEEEVKEGVLPKTDEVQEEVKEGVLPKTGEVHEEEHPLPTLEARVEKKEEEEEVKEGVLPTTDEVHEEEHPLPTLEARVEKKEEEEEVKEGVLPTTDEVHEEEHPLPTLEARVEKKDEEEEDKGKEVREKSSMICAPIIVAGSALLFSLAFIVRYFRSANRTPKPRN